MSFDDIAARFKQKKKQSGQEEKPYDHQQSYAIRGKMLGVLLRDARETAARTVEDCARLLHIPTETILSWEFGDTVPTLPQLELLAYYLNVPVSHFWGLETISSDSGNESKAKPEFISLRNRMIGAQLRKAREEAGLSLEEVAEYAALEPATVQNYELGDLAPPMHELSVLASAVKQNISYFTENTGHIGELLAMREAWKHFSDLPEDVRAFAADPKNIGFIHIAVMLSQMPSDRLRKVGESILDITM